MAKTKLFFGEEARTKLFTGMEKVYKAVSVTLGSRGRNAVYREFGRPKINNDGVSIARKIFLEDETESMGSDLILEAAEKTNEEVGDGTSTVTILTYWLITEGQRLLKENADYTPMQLRKELEKALEEAKKKLSEVAIKVQGDEELVKVANISAEDKDIAKLVAQAVKEAGETGRVVTEYSTGLKIEKERVEGMEWEGGVLSHYFILNQEKMESVWEDVHVLLSDKTFVLNADIFPLIQEMSQKGYTKLVLICKDVQSEVLATFVQNRVKGAFTVVAVKAPRDREMLEDLSALCGKQPVTDDRNIKRIDFSHLVKVRKVAAYKNKTLIAKGDRTEAEEMMYKERVKSLKESLKNAKGEDKIRLEDRLARLTSSVVLIKAGASTDTEVGYLVLKIEDAVNAVKAAIQEGYVAGGGITLRHIGQEVNKKLNSLGSKLLERATSKPVEILIQNAGAPFEPEKLNDTDGFDTDSGKYIKNIIDHGIIDPVLVEKSALTNAVSLAAMFLTVDTAISKVADEKTTV